MVKGGSVCPFYANHDSFTNNFGELLLKHGKVNFKITRPEELVLKEVQYYDKILISPGHGVPTEHPAIFRLLETFLESKPILGICLGHQAIGAYFGAEIENLAQVIHGQPRRLNIADPYHYLFQGIDDKTLVSPYHSWIIGNKGFPDYLKIFALSEEGFIMAISHRIYDVCGIQFHPESIMTASGQRIINNWIDHS